MLTFIDKYQSIILSVILVFYIGNSIYIGSSNLSFILFLLVILMQVIRLRKHIKKLSFLQFAAIFATMVAFLAGLVSIFIGLNYLISNGIMSFPDWMIMVIQIAFIIVFMLSLTTIVRSMYERFTHSKA
ncbi:hypothetical protein ACFPYN_14580 [Paenisporosarcina macmurdoensis]|uniref:Uncharacterized protein n=1 Tax=Paenisporosarcina macmurdoensis TaxID=212659 RepID=A0ABW1L9L8_9BACL